MNFNQLRYILAVDKYGGFAKAAKECHVSQSTISKEIQRLEEEFGIMIFDRSRLPVRPTMKGEDLLIQARRILEQKQQFVDIALKKDNLPRGSFRLGILPMIAPYLLPLFVRSLSDKYPHLQMEIIEMAASDMVRHLDREDLDGCIAIHPFYEEGYYEDVLFEEEFVAYLGLGHPLSAKTEIAWTDIPPADLILHEDLTDYLLHPLENGGHKKAITSQISNLEFRSGSLETIRKIIDRSGGITLLPRISTLYMGARRLKMVRPVTDPPLKRKITLVTPRGFEKNRLTKVIKHEILQNLPEYDAGKSS